MTAARSCDKMDRIQELLGRITELSDDELNELRDLVLSELDSVAPEGEDVPADTSLEVIETLANAAEVITAEEGRREEVAATKAAKFAQLNDFRNRQNGEEAPEEETEETQVDVELSTETPEPEAAEEAPSAEETAQVDAEDAAQAEEPEDNEAPAEEESTAVTADAGEETEVPEVPEDRRPQARETAKTTVIRAGADLPGYAMGSEFTSREDLAAAFAKRIETMRGIRGGDGDKLIVASAALDGVRDEIRLGGSDAELNTRKVFARMSEREQEQTAIVAAGGLGAPEEVRYDLFDMVGSTDRPVRDTLPVFVTERGGIRFMRPPTLNDVNGVVGIWTVQDDIDALTDTAVRKPSFRVQPGPEVVVDTQAITMIMTFGNLMTRAYPELVARHTDLAMVAWARVAEQQLLAQIGALSLDVVTPNQRVGAVRELLMDLSRATASYRNRHRMAAIQPLRAIFPLWFREVLRADVAVDANGTLDNLDIADARIDAFFRSRNVNVTWAYDGEAGQEFAELVDNRVLVDYPMDVVWYLFAEGTFAFMDGGTLDLGLVRDSTLNAANDYQTFVESFENVVKFGHESLRFVSRLAPTGATGSPVAIPAPKLVTANTGVTNAPTLIAASAAYS
jgi:hypothetical protein